MSNSLLLLGAGISGKPGAVPTSTSSSSSSSTTTAAPFQPTDIGDLILWLDGSDTTTLWQDTSGTVPADANGDAIARWDDKSGQNNDAISPGSGYYPALLDPAKNSLPAPDFDSSVTQKYLEISPLAATMGLQNTTFVVVKQAADNNPRCVLDFRKDSGGAQNDLWFVGSNLVVSNFLVLVRDNAGSLNNVQDGAVDGNWHYYTAGYDGSTLSIQDGTASATTKAYTAGATDLNYVRIGFSWAGAPFQGQIAEIVVYDRQLTAGEITDVQTYLSDKWGF